MSVAANLAGKLETVVLNRISAGKLVLPVVPDVAQKCLNVLKEANFQQRKLTAAMEADPLLSAMVVKTAAAAIHGGGQVRGLDQALSRLGAAKIKTLIVEYMAHELFRSSDQKIEQASKAVWVHSVAVAHLARDLRTFSGNDTEADIAYLAGLLHDIGKPVVAAMLLEVERASESKRLTAWIDDGVWRQAVDAVHRKIGTAIATAWQLDEQVTAAIRDSNDYDAGNRDCIANVVRFANALAKKAGYAAGPVDEADVDAMIMVGRSMLNADDTLIERLTAGLSTRMGRS